MTTPPITDANPNTIGYETITPWWIVPIDTNNYTATLAPNQHIAKWNAEIAYYHDYGTWPKHIGPPRQARTNEIRNYAATIRETRRLHQLNPKAHPPPTDHSLALLELIEAQPTGAPQPTTPTPPPTPPPTPLIDPTYLKQTWTDLLKLWLWVITVTAPLIASAIYWYGHYQHWWTAIGWNRTTGWFTNRHIITGYILWYLLPISGMWMLTVLISTGPWINRTITHRPHQWEALRGTTPH